jgi:hypothetical protein
VNYAFSPVDGYEGLLLHALSPALAEKWYPILTHPKLEAALGIITQVRRIPLTLTLRRCAGDIHSR